jgi:hypothetical protein
MTTALRIILLATLVGAPVLSAGCARDPHDAPRSEAIFTAAPADAHPYRDAVRADTLDANEATQYIDVVTRGDVIVTPLTPGRNTEMAAVCIEPDHRRAYMDEQIRAGGVFRVTAGRHVRIIGPLPSYHMPYYALVTDDGWTGTACDDGLPTLTG